MLAWLRTGVAIIALGFVVARFGLVLRLLQVQDGAATSPALSSYLGGALVGLGVLATAGGAIEFRRFCRTIPPAERPRSASPGFVLGMTWVLMLLGIALGIVLVL